MTTAADAEVLQRVLRESGVDQSVPAPSWGAYGAALLERLVEGVFGHLPDLGFLRGLSAAVGPGLILAVIGLVVLVLFLVARSMRDARRHRLGADPSAVLTIPSAAPVPENDREGWRKEIDRRLAAGDFAGALEALWWWFARALTTARVDPAWTSRELLAHARRPELGGLALGLDRLLYGPSRPRAEDIDRFLRRAEEALP
jgi:hypothetical protein